LAIGCNLLYKGEHAWYPFLEQTLVAIFHLVTRIPVQTIYVSYPFIISGPVVLIFIFFVQKLFKSTSFTLISLFALLFVIPWTTHQLTLNLHPVVLALGMLPLALYLFYRAVLVDKFTYWILAGVGIAVLIYTQTIAALTFCGGVTLYLLFNKKIWRGFMVMVFTSFVLVSPYLLPLMISYRLTPQNTFGTFYFSYYSFLDALLYGLGPIRFVNLFFIDSGLVVFFLSKKIHHKIILAVFFFGLVVEYSGIARYYNLLPSFVPIFVPQDFQLFNHEIAIFPFAAGALFWFHHMGLFLGKKRSLLWLFTGTIIVSYVVLMVPQLNQRATDRRELLANTYYDSEWLRVTDWIWQNTKIDDVFLVHQDSAYTFINGMTGRKVVANENVHSNTFVNQQLRGFDNMALYQSANLTDFKKLAGKYDVAYVVVSPYEQNLPGYSLEKFVSDSFFALEYSSDNVKIFRLNW